MDMSQYVSILRRRWPLACMIFLGAVLFQLHRELSHFPSYTAQAYLELPPVWKGEEFASVGVIPSGPFSYDGIEALLSNEEFRKEVLASMEKKDRRLASQAQKADWFLTHGSRPERVVVTVRAPSPEAASELRKGLLSHLQKYASEQFASWRKDLLAKIEALELSCAEKETQTEERLLTIFGSGIQRCLGGSWSETVSSLRKELEAERARCAALRDVVGRWQEKKLRLATSLPWQSAGALGGTVLSEALTSQVRKVVTLRMELAEERLTKSDTHPAVKRLREKLAHAEKTLGDLAAGDPALPASLARAYDQAHAAMVREAEQVDARLKTLQEDLAGAEEGCRSVEASLRQLAENRSRYESLALKLSVLRRKKQKLGELRRIVSFHTAFSPLSVLHASMLVPPEAESLDTTRIVGCALLALVVAVAVSFMADLSSSRIVEAAQVPLLFRAPILGVIRANESGGSEGYSLFQKRLEKVDKIQSVVLAACGGEVDTQALSRGLARAAVSAGRRVLLVSCAHNGHREGMSHHAEVPLLNGREEGRWRLAGLAKGQKTFTDFIGIDFAEDSSPYPITMTEYEGLDRVAWAPYDSPLGEVAQRIGTVVRYAHQRYDLTVVEAPGTVSPAAAALLGSEAHGVVIAVVPGRTSIRQVASIMRACEGTGARVIGFVAVVDSEVRVGNPIRQVFPTEAMSPIAVCEA